MRYCSISTPRNGRFNIMTIKQLVSLALIISASLAWAMEVPSLQVLAAKKVLEYSREHMESADAMTCLELVGHVFKNNGITDYKELMPEIGDGLISWPVTLPGQDCFSCIGLF